MVEWHSVAKRYSIVIFGGDARCAVPDGLSSHIPSSPGAPHRGVGCRLGLLAHAVMTVGAGPTPWIQMDGLMHYSPFAAGTGLFVVWYVAPAGSPPALVARFLIDCAGLVFVAILAFFLLTNLYGAARALLPHPRRTAGRHVQQRSGLMSLRA